MKVIAFVAAAATVAYVTVVYVLQKDSDRFARLAEEELRGLKEHFKSLDQV